MGLRSLFGLPSDADFQLAQNLQNNYDSLQISSNGKISVDISELIDKNSEQQIRQQVDASQHQSTKGKK